LFWRVYDSKTPFGVTYTHTFGVTYTHTLSNHICTHYPITFFIELGSMNTYSNTHTHTQVRTYMYIIYRYEPLGARAAVPASLKTKTK
jgi:hypothetical protein